MSADDRRQDGSFLDKEKVAELLQAKAPLPPNTTQILSPPERTSLECLRFAVAITVARLRRKSGYAVGSGAGNSRTKRLENDVIQLAARFEQHVRAGS